MRDPNRDRFMRAVRHEQSAEIPLFEYDPDTKIVNQLMDSSFPLSVHPFELEATDSVELNRIMGNDMVYFSHVWRVGRKEQADAEGRIHYIDGIIKSENDFGELWFPDLDAIESRLERTVQLAHDSGFGLVYGSQSAAFTSTVAIGFEDFCFAVIDRPGFVYELQRRLQEYANRELEMALSYPIDMVKIGSGLVTKNGPMLSPEMMETFEGRLLREHAVMTKEKDLPLMLHIDGYIEPMIEQFISMGVDLLNPIEPCAGKQDIYRLKTQYGDRIAFSGNIDVDGVLMRGTPDEVAEDVVRHIEALAPGGGYCVSSSHNLHELIPAENFSAMRDAVHGYRFDHDLPPRT